MSDTGEMTFKIKSQILLGFVYGENALDGRALALDGMALGLMAQGSLDGKSPAIQCIFPTKS